MNSQFEKPRNLLTVLGLAPSLVRSVRDEQIKKVIEKQFESLSFVYHPDRGGSAADFDLIKSARDLLIKDPEILRISKDDLLRQTIVAEENNDLRHALGEVTHGQECLLAFMRGLCSQIAGSHGPTCYSIRPAKFVLCDKSKVARIEFRRDTGMLTKDERLLLDKRDALTRKIQKEGATLENAQIDANRMIFKMTLEVEDNGEIVIVAGKTRQSFKDKIVIGTSYIFNGYEGLQPKELKRDEEMTPYSAGMYSQRPLRGMIAEEKVRGSLDLSHIPLSQASNLIPYINPILGGRIKENGLLTLNFPDDQEPFLRVEGSLLSAETRGTVVDINPQRGAD